GREKSRVRAAAWLGQRGRYEGDQCADGVSDPTRRIEGRVPGRRLACPVCWPPVEDEGCPLGRARPRAARKARRLRECHRTLLVEGVCDKRRVDVRAR